MKTTKWFIIAALVVIVGYDIYAAIAHIGTISGVIRDVSKTYPIIPFCGGVVVGHLWWNR